MFWILSVSCLYGPGELFNRTGKAPRHHANSELFITKRGCIAATAPSRSQYNPVPGNLDLCSLFDMCVSRKGVLTFDYSIAPDTYIVTCQDFPYELGVSAYTSVVFQLCTYQNCFA